MSVTETVLHSLEELRVLSHEVGDRPSLEENFKRRSFDTPRTIVAWMRDVTETLEKQRAHEEAKKARYAPLSQDLKDKPFYFIDKDEGKQLVDRLGSLDDLWSRQNFDTTQPDMHVRFIALKALITNTLLEHKDHLKLSGTSRSTLENLTDALNDFKDIHGQSTKVIERIAKGGRDAVDAVVEEGKLSEGQFMKVAATVLELDIRVNTHQDDLRIQTKNGDYRITPKQAAQLLDIEQKIDHLKNDPTGSKKRSLLQRQSYLLNAIGLHSGYKLYERQKELNKIKPPKEPMSNKALRASSDKKAMQARTTFMEALKQKGRVDEIIETFALRDNLLDILTGGVDTLAKHAKISNSQFRNRYIQKLRRGFENLFHERQNVDPVIHGRQMYDAEAQSTFDTAADIEHIPNEKLAIRNVAELDLSDPEIAFELRRLIDVAGDAFYDLTDEQKATFIDRWMLAENEEDQEEILTDLRYVVAPADEEADDRSELTYEPNWYELADSLPLDKQVDLSFITNTSKKDEADAFFRAFFTKLPPITETDSNPYLRDTRTIFLHKSPVSRAFDQMSIYRLDPDTGDFRQYTIFLKDFNRALGANKEVYFTDSHTPEKEDSMRDTLNMLAGHEASEGFLTLLTTHDIHVSPDHSLISEADHDRIVGWFDLMTRSTKKQLTYERAQQGGSNDQDSLRARISNAESYTITLEELRNICGLPFYVPGYSHKHDTWKEQLATLLGEISVGGAYFSFDGDAFEKSLEHAGVRRPTLNIKQFANEHLQKILSAMSQWWTSDAIATIQYLTLETGTIDGFKFMPKDTTQKPIFIRASTLAKAFGLHTARDEAGVRKLTIGMVKILPESPADLVKVALGNLSVGGTLLPETITVERHMVRSNR